MTLPKIKKFTDYNHYPDEAQPTTDADMQDYMQNQNDILGALTKRLWQPQTEYKLGDIVASDTMADGLVAVCTIAGVTSDIEPTWGVNEATVIDNSCTWIMRPAYCYGLATEGDVQTVYDGGEAEVSRLLSVGVLDKIFALIKDKFTDLFGSNDVLPIEHGGTGQTTKAAVRNTLGLGNTTGALPVANGGTGATTAKQARENLEVEPIGTIFAFAGNNIPSGYLPCNGSAISRTTYADLFAVIGTTYGGGNGGTTFNLPNLTDKFIQGSDTAGTVKSAGLPNITSRITAGTFEGYALALSSMLSNGIQKGALKFSDFTAWAESGWSDKATYAKVLDFNASWSNSIYGNSTTVQPPALTMRYIIKY